MILESKTALFERVVDASLTANAPFTTKLWYCFRLPSYDLEKLVASSSAGLFTDLLKAWAVKSNPLEVQSSTGQAKLLSSSTTRHSP